MQDASAVSKALAVLEQINNGQTNLKSCNVFCGEDVEPCMKGTLSKGKNGTELVIF